MLTKAQSEHILQTADLVYSADTIEKTITQLATDITAKLGTQHPLILCVMKGGVVFAGHLLPKLAFPLDFDCIQISRYHNQTSGGQLDWVLTPREQLKDRVVLVIDDILDEGVTLAEIRTRVLASGARSFYSVVLVDKQLDRPKAVQADFIGLNLPNRYVFGFGMDVHGAWRNLPAIYALQAEAESE